MYINVKFTRKLLFQQLWFSHTSPSLRRKTFPPSLGNPSPRLQEAPKDKIDQFEDWNALQNQAWNYEDKHLHRLMGILSEKIAKLLTYFFQFLVFNTEKIRGKTSIVTITIRFFFYFSFCDKVYLFIFYIDWTDYFLCHGIETVLHPDIRLLWSAFLLSEISRKEAAPTALPKW